MTLRAMLTDDRLLSAAHAVSGGTVAQFAARLGRSRRAVQRWKAGRIPPNGLPADVVRLCRMLLTMDPFTPAGVDDDVRAATLSHDR